VWFGFWFASIKAFGKGRGGRTTVKKESKPEANTKISGPDDPEVESSKRGFKRGSNLASDGGERFYGCGITATGRRNLQRDRNQQFDKIEKS